MLCCAVLSGFCCVWLFVTPWTVACQEPLSMGFSRQETILKEEMWRLGKGLCDNLSFTLAHFLLSSLCTCSACWGWGWSNLASVLVLREQKDNLQGKENFDLGTVWLRNSTPLRKGPQQDMANSSENKAHSLLKVQPIFRRPAQHKLSPWRPQKWTGDNWSFSRKRGRICCLLWFHHLHTEVKGSVSKASQKENKREDVEDSCVSKETPAVSQKEWQQNQESIAARDLRALHPPKELLEIVSLNDQWRQVDKQDLANPGKQDSTGKGIEAWWSWLKDRESVQQPQQQHPPHLFSDHQTSLWRR